MIKFRKNVRIAPFSTFGIGGRAEYFYEAKTPDDLIRAIRRVKELKLPFRIFAGGSNVVFPGGKLKGLLIRFEGGRIMVKGNKFTADAGVSLASVIEKSIDLGLRGLETLSGIPGTLGGAVVGNAGAYGHSISEITKRVEIWDPFNAVQGGPFDAASLDSARDRQDRRKWIKNPECHFKYRESIFKHRPYPVLRIELGFKKGNRGQLKKISKDIIKIREKKYKPGLRCPGSFFKNVLLTDINRHSLRLIDRKKIIDGKIPAGYLLEEIGARGMKMGGVRVADFHGNLIMNAGRAKASEVKKMAGILKRKVLRKFGIKLEEEVRYF